MERKVLALPPPPTCTKKKRELLELITHTISLADVIRLDIRRNCFFVVRVGKHWHKLLGEVVDDPSLETFKV